MKKLLVILLVLAPTVLFAQTSRPRALSFGLWGTNASPVATDSLVASGAADTTNSRIITLEPAARYNGDATLVVDYDYNSGTWPTITVEYRAYYPEFDADADAADDSTDFSAWYTIGSEASKPAAALIEYNLSSLSDWKYHVGHQIRFRAASGTYNIDLTARAYIR